MTRSEMYGFIKSHNLGAEFQTKYGKNFTQGKTTELETFIAEHSKGSDFDVDAHTYNGVSCEGKKQEVDAHIDNKKVEGRETQEVILKDIEKPKNFNTVKAIIKLVTVLQSEDVITAEEAQEVLDELNAK